MIPPQMEPHYSLLTAPGVSYTSHPKKSGRKAPDYSDPTYSGISAIASNLLCDLGQVPPLPGTQFPHLYHERTGLRSSLRVFLAQNFKDFSTIWPAQASFFFKTAAPWGRICSAGPHDGCGSERNSQSLQMKPGQLGGLGASGGLWI